MTLKTSPNALKTTSNELKSTPNYASFGLNEAVFRRNFIAGKGLPKHPHRGVFKASGNEELRRKTSADKRQNIRKSLFWFKIRPATKTEKKFGWFNEI